MKSLIIDKELVNNNIWKENPYLLTLKTFKYIYDSDTSEGKEESSKYIWAIYLVYDYYSRYAHLPLEQRIKIVEEEFLQEPSFFSLNKELLEPIITLYLDLEKTSERRYLEVWKDAVDKRTKFLESTEYNLNNFDLIDKMLLNSVKILSQKGEIEAAVNKQEAHIKGGVVLGLLARGDLKL